MAIHDVTMDTITKLANHAYELILEKSLEEGDITEESYKKMLLRKIVITDNNGYFSHNMSNLRLLENNNENKAVFWVVKIENASKTWTFVK